MYWNVTRVNLMKQGAADRPVSAFLKYTTPEGLNNIDKSVFNPALTWG